METYRIHINGIVQGVGFRPLVYQLAKEMRLNGYVKNGSDGVHVFFNASNENANSFFRRIQQDAPKQSKIISSQINEIAHTVFSDFSIIVEEDNSEKNVLMSPDKAICENCRNELHNVSNRRYRYPFITCTQCGSRYSIINELPYERHSTSMQKFKMCERCNEEYNNVFDRRFFSQTNSCDECGITLSLYNKDSKILSNSTEEILSQIKSILEEGKIITVKGIGGYLLLCGANKADSIQLLRNRKHRPSKPFAILYPDIKKIEDDFEINNQERQLLKSEETPIVLLYPKQKAFTNLSIKNIAPCLKRLGVMLPSNPLLDLIANDFGKPLIATSANISGSPIIYKDEDAMEYLFEIS